VEFQKFPGRTPGPPLEEEGKVRHVEEKWNETKRERRGGEMEGMVGE
jgi:hypothetical protein